MREKDANFEDQVIAPQCSDPSVVGQSELADYEIPAILSLCLQSDRQSGTKCNFQQTLCKSTDVELLKSFPKPQMYIH